LVGYNTITTTKIKTDVEKSQTSIDSIQTKIHSDSIINTELDLKLDSLDTNINQITKEIDVVDNNINVIKKKTNEKIVVVDHYDNAELNGFFSGRYGN
jgi:archaellum component FlaC